MNNGLMDVLEAFLESQRISPNNMGFLGIEPGSSSSRWLRKLAYPASPETKEFMPLPLLDTMIALYHAIEH